MMLRIILSIIVIMIFLVILFIVVPMWKMITRTMSVFKTFEIEFNIFPEEIPNLFPEGKKQTIQCGKVRLEFSNIIEACNEFEKYIEELLGYYEKYAWLVNLNSNLSADKDKLYVIRERVMYLY